MKLILISNPVNLSNEHALLCSLFENGLEYFHLRKPDFTYDEMEAYLQQIPAKHLSKVVIHSHYHLADKYSLKGKHKTFVNIRVKKFLADERRDYNIEKNKTLHTSANISEISVKQIIVDNYISSSFHSTEELMECNYNYEYVFLSPIFNSISKENYSSTFNKNELKLFLKNYTKKTEIIALGGISKETIHQAIDLGFDGVAVLGAIWNDSYPVQKFKELKKSCHAKLDSASVNWK